MTEPAPPGPDALAAAPERVGATPCGSPPAGGDGRLEPAGALAPTPPVRTSRRLPRRLVQLYAGLALYGVSSGLLVSAGLGLEPWGVLHQGLSELTGLSIGLVTVVVGVAVLLAWIPMRQRPGLGTVSNALLIGPFIDLTLALAPTPEGLTARIATMVAAIALNGAATGLYIAAALGPGPRDGLMTGLHRRTGRSVRLVRTALEVTVVLTGLLLGGSAGIGTVLYALSIGPLAQFFLRVFAVRPAPTVPTGVAAPQPAPGMMER